MKKVKADVTSDNICFRDKHEVDTELAPELENIRHEIIEKQKHLDAIIDGLWDDVRKREVINLSKDLDQLINEYLKLTMKT